MEREPLQTGIEANSVGDHGRHSLPMGRGWMMVGCAVMLVVAAALVVGGAASAALIASAGLCMLMMAVMMAGMKVAVSYGRGHGHH